MLFTVTFSKAELDELLLALTDRQDALDERVSGEDDGSALRDFYHHRLIVRSLMEFLAEAEGTEEIRKCSICGVGRVYGKGHYCLDCLRAEMQDNMTSNKPVIGPNTIRRG